MLSDKQLIETLDKATHLANMGYVVKRFFADANLTFERGIAQLLDVPEIAEIDYGDQRLTEILKFDKGHRRYVWPENAMGRWGENTGDENLAIYFEIDSQMKDLGKNILPATVALVRELRTTKPEIVKELADEYAMAMGFKGAAGESDYIKMLESYGDSEYYEPYTPFSHAIFGEQIKKICIMAANSRNLVLYPVEDLPFSDYVWRNIEHTKILATVRRSSAEPR